MNRLFIILTFILVAVCTAYSQPRENYKTSAKIVKVSQLATNFIKWEYNDHYLKWEGALNDKSFCTSSKDIKSVKRYSAEVQSHDENIQSMRIRKISYNNNYWYLLSITSYDGAYKFPLIFKDWIYWKVTNLYVIYPDQYRKLLNLQNNNNDVIIYAAGSYLINSNEKTLSTEMSTIFRNGKVEHSPGACHFYIRVENANTIRLLFPSSKRLGSSRELNFNKYYFEIPKNDFNKAIWFDKMTPAPITIPTPDPQSNCDINNYSTKTAAHFIGGTEAMEAYIKSNMRYPSNSYYNRIEGTVIISTEIKHDGSIGDQKVKQSVNDELDREAQRIISYMPKWEPATEEGTKMKSIVDISIKFQISDFEK